MIINILYILLVILIFGLLITFHEFGHFITAKLSGVRVNEFAVGMGPAIFKKKKGETVYALRAIPFGGFCAMEGEDGAIPGSRLFPVQAPVEENFDCGCRLGHEPAGGARGARRSCLRPPRHGMCRRLQRFQKMMQRSPRADLCLGDNDPARQRLPRTHVQRRISRLGTRNP